MRGVGARVNSPGRGNLPAPAESIRDTSPTQGRDVTRSRRSSSDLPGPSRVEAVVVEHADGTCSGFRHGTSSHWPSLSAAFEMSASLEWRQSTPGIWVGRPASEGEELAS